VIVLYELFLSCENLEKPLDCDEGGDIMRIEMLRKLNLYLARVSVFLIMAALIAGMAGCGPIQYDLIISSTEGGEVTNPGEGTFTYDEGTVVDLVAEADKGYLFVNWTGNVSAIANVYAASTTITMNGDYSITANFAIAIEIWDWYDLDDVRDNLAGNYTLMNDLDSTTSGYEELASPTANGGKGWEPIGIYYSEESHWCFKGTFDGQGHEIRDLFVNYPDDDNFWCAGLFSNVEQYGVIKDIGVVNATVAGVAVAGGLVGINDGAVSNSYFTGNVTGTWQVGGLVGDNYGTVCDSYAAGNVTGEEWDAGGLVGANSGTVSDSYSTGSVTGNEYVGGLVGRNWRDVSNSYYNYDEVLINGQNAITIGALFDEDFEQWLANDRFLDVSERLSHEDGYYSINDVSDFKQLLAFGQNDALKFRLTNDLDLATEPNFYIPYFAGEFDGNGHKISNLSFNFDFVSYVGLFGYLASGGTVHEVAAESVNITACRDIGGLVGFNMGTVSNSYSIGSVTGKYSVGGLVGYIWEGNVINSYFTGSVTGSLQYVGGLVGQNEEGNVINSYSTGSVSGVEYVGGLVGYSAYGNVAHCYSTGNVTGDSHVGGLVGDNYIGSSISNSYFSGSVTGNVNVVGGLVGYNADLATVSNSYATGNVTGNWSVGGLVGENDGTVSNSYASGTVVGTGESVGGLMGSNGGPVSNSYATGSVAGDKYVGGLVGWNYGTISNSYSTGSVTGSESVGGLVGGNTDTVSNSFWGIQTSGQATSAGGTGKNTTEMQYITTFSGATWDIVAVADSDTRNPAYIWNIVDDVTYPFLSWQPV
jgi:hypothetical protein